MGGRVSMGVRALVAVIFARHGAVQMATSAAMTIGTFRTMLTSSDVAGFRAILIALPRLSDDRLNQPFRFQGAHHSRQGLVHCARRNRGSGKLLLCILPMAYGPFQGGHNELTSILQRSE